MRYVRLFLLALLPVFAAAQTVQFKSSNVAITGGAIDNTAIGATTQTTGKFTTITASSNAGVGGNTTGSVGMFVRNTALTGTTQTGVDTNMVSTSAATTKTVGFLGEVGTAAAAYTSSIRAQFWSSPPTKGAGSTITNDIGFLATDITQGGTTNIGFDSAVSSGTGKWNFYGEGTASNAFAGSTRIGSTVAPTVALDVTGAVSASTQYNVNGVLHVSATAPSVTGFGSSPSVPNNNGTSAFTVNVGTGGTANTGSVTLPAAATGWVCTAQDVTTPASFVTAQTGGTTTTATFANYSRTTGLLTAWTASDVLRVSCFAY